MRQTSLITLFILLIYSCNFRIYTDNKKTARLKEDNKNWKSSNHSCLVFHITDSLPESLTYINTTKIKAPFVWFNPASPNNVMTEIAKNQAAKISANVIKVVDYGKPNYTFTVKMYRLNNKSFTEYKKKLDSLKIESEKTDKNFCVVHIRSFCWVRGLIYFNDSLVGNFHATTNNRTLSHIHTLDFKLASEGFLSAQRKIENNIYYKGIWLLKGNEYYLELVISKHGNYLQKISKDDYY